jgi:formylmethanofuran dehydrogenase subunit E
MIDLQALIAASAARHSHLCPRQVLGVRAGLAGTTALGLDVPRCDKRLLVILETDGCFADGVEVVTGTTIGHRTLRVQDYGKTAATFVDTHSEKAYRVRPCRGVRQKAWLYAPGEDRHYFAQLTAYQCMPEEELFDINEIRLTPPVKAIISIAGLRTECARCGEEIINQREIHQDGLILCRACAGQGYYETLVDFRSHPRAPAALFRP